MNFVYLQPTVKSHTIPSGLQSKLGAGRGRILKSLSRCAPETVENWLSTPGREKPLSLTPAGGKKLLGPIRDSLFLSLVLSFDSRVKNLASPRKKGISRSFVPRKMQISASRAESDTCYNGTGTGNSARKMLHTHIEREKGQKGGNNWKKGKSRGSQDSCRAHKSGPTRARPSTFTRRDKGYICSRRQRDNPI